MLAGELLAAAAAESEKRLSEEGSELERKQVMKHREHVATEATGRADPDRFRVSFGEVSLIAPPGALGGTPLRWAHGPRALGGDPPVFTGD